VSILETLSSDLASMADGLATAQRNAAAADHAAEQIARRAVAGGFVGIAQNMARVREAIKQIHAAVTAAGVSVNEARAPVEQAPKQASPQETAAALAPVVERVNAVGGSVNAAVETVNQAQKVAASVLQGGSPGPMLARLDAIKQALVQVNQRGAVASQHVEAALKEVRTVGDAGN
jgi:hypothetical protein